MLKYFHYIFLSFVFLTNQPIHAQTWELKWSDEFEYTGLPDNTKWGYDVGGGGWGNNELQYYTNARQENARVENGVLIIEAIKESYGGMEYTSARLVSRNKGDWKYGRIEVRAKLPGGRGTWPAIWMLPTDWVYGNWPSSGEIDIMEYVGYDPGIVHGTVHTHDFNHTLGTQLGASITVTDAETAYHLYAIEWFEDKIDFYVDNNKYFTFTNQGTWQKWPFDQRFHLLLNIAIGGNWGGVQGVDASIFPVKMYIDYVRIYQNAGELKITGEEFTEPNMTGLTYSVSDIVGALYSWSVPEGATIVSGQNTNSIIINWGSIEGNINCTITIDDIPTAISFPVKLVHIPDGDLFSIDDFDNGTIDNINFAQGINNFEFIESNNELKVVYNVSDAGLIPNFTISLERPVKLSELQVMQVKFKTFNLSTSVVARIDLEDVYGVRTNGTYVFRLDPIYSDGEYHLYEFDFTDRWISNSPVYGAPVNKNKINKAIMYLNYGFYGKDNKTDSVWIDYIHMIKEKVISSNHVELSSVFKIYPNPFKDILFIDPHPKNFSIEIFNFTGKKIVEYKMGNLEKNHLNLGYLPVGIYGIIISDSKGYIIESKKLVKLN